MRADVMTQGGLWKNLLRMLRLVETKEEEEERMCKLYSLPAGDLIAYVSAGRKLDKLANEVIQDVKKPWLAKDAEMWDNLSVEDWLLKEVSNTAARGILRGIVLAVFCLPTTGKSSCVQYEVLMIWLLHLAFILSLFDYLCKPHVLTEAISSLFNLQSTLCSCFLLASRLRVSICSLLVHNHIVLSKDLVHLCQL